MDRYMGNPNLNPVTATGTATSTLPLSDANLQASMKLIPRKELWIKLVICRVKENSVVGIVMNSIWVLGSE